MERSDFLAAFERDGARFAADCEAAGLGAPVPSCPSWMVVDLLGHLTQVYGFWNAIVRERRTSPEGLALPDRPADAALLDAFCEQHAALLGTLRDTDPTQVMWSWSPTGMSVGWLVRRMAHETAVHRWDADGAAGSVTPIDPPLASDGIDEYLAEFLPWAAADAAPVGGTVHLHCTDTPGEWLVVPAGDGFTVTREHAKGDCAIRGAASDLLLALWRRVPLTAVDVIGDGEVAARFVAHTSMF